MWIFVVAQVYKPANYSHRENKRRNLRSKGDQRTSLTSVATKNLVSTLSSVLPWSFPLLKLDGRRCRLVDSFSLSSDGLAEKIEKRANKNMVRWCAYDINHIYELRIKNRRESELRSCEAIGLSLQLLYNCEDHFHFEEYGYKRRII